jgi:death on curing protein
MGIIRDIIGNIANLLNRLMRVENRSSTATEQKQNKYFYISPEEVIEFNKRVTRQAGLLRDQAGLESAIMRPQMAAYYEETDIAAQTALLIEGIAMAHAFVDGNKRTALIAGVTFLGVNGYKLQDARDRLAKQIEELVTGRDIEQFTKWLRIRIKLS